ncbi:MAG: phenylalanine--tRNA ligase subunit beta [Candidatus Marinimicrobia bacterium]|nr:phenylalanine--tRNA ligase subunit beta [Candidatus Neomarinimicrobiota bacterium]
MKISRNWLNDYIISSKTDTELVDFFTQLGLECTVSQFKYNFSNVTVGKVIKCSKHPNADKLKLCEVDLGNKIEEIICGAPNVKDGLTVPVAKVGSKVGELKIKKVKIRDIYSNGMICSGKELGINDDNNGIMVLDSNLNAGDDFIDALNLKEDSIFDFDITPNRGDCFSHLGIARELAIIEKKKINIKKYKLKLSNFKTSDLIDVKIHKKDLCSRYSCRIIKNISVNESTDWLKNKLSLINQKSINNIVDLSNFIMFDTGQPLHVFDLDKLKGKINIRLAKKNEEFITLDNIKLKLSEEDIVIADDEKPVALAGVIGGINSNVDSSTKNILIESAVFDEIRIRKTSKKYDYSKEASKRFERGIDLNNTVDSMNKFSSLLVDTSKADIASDYIDVYSTKNTRLIAFDVMKCNDFLGTSLNSKKIKDIFSLLNINCSKEINSFNCTIPSYRNDIEFEVDLFEEVARVYGYNNIPSNNNFYVPSNSFINDQELLDDKIRNFLSSNGFNEHYSNSLYSKKDCDLNSDLKPVKLINPLSIEMEYVRNSLFPGLMRAVSFNQRRGKKFIKLFEIGNISFLCRESSSKTSQIKKVMLVWVGDKINHWNNPLYQDLFSIKGELKSLFNMLNILNVNFKLNDKKLDVLIGKKVIGYLKSVDKNNLKSFGISSDIFVCSIDLHHLFKYFNNKIVYNKIYSFPSIERDISILINKKYTNEEIVNSIFQNGGEYLNDVELFDLYEGNEIPKDSKSLAYSLKFKSNSKTLTDKEVDIFFDKILNVLKSSFKAKQR